MNNNIKEILAELYALDDTLRAHEKELEKIITHMLEASPAIAIDQTFLARLRSQLGEQVGKLSRPAISGRFQKILTLFARPSFALGALITVLVILPALSVFLRQEAPRAVALKPTSHTALDKNAFGSLTMSRTAQETATKMTAPASRPQSGGGSGGMGGGVAGSGYVDSAMMIAPPYEYTVYKFSYKGEPLKLDEATMPVYRKAINPSIAQALAQAVAGTGIGVFDLSKLQNARASFITIVEDRDRGYVASINLDDNSFSMYINSAQWPPIWKSVSGESSTMPSDDEILTITDSFARAYSIDLSGYGPGKVIHNEQNVYMMAPTGVATKGEMMMPAIMAPTEVSVLYPLMVDGKQVYDQGGSEAGMAVNVNIPLRAVTGIGSIQTNRYEQSVYDAETDGKKIIAIAERGGVFGGYPQPEGTKVVTVELDTPTLQFMFYSLFDEKTQRSQELYVPALVFPVKDAGKHENLYQKNIIVPIIKNILENQYGTPVPVPMKY